MKRMQVTLALAVLAIVGVLLYNRSRMTAESDNGYQKAIPVAATTASPMTFAGARSFVGTIVPNNDVVIVSETEGKIVALSAKVGDFKPAGAVLFQVDDELKKAAFSSAEAAYDKAKKDFERFESLRAEHAVTDQQYESTRLALKSAEAQYIAARKQYNDTKITTPIAGIVTARMVDFGTMVQSKMPVANVVDISRLKVKLNLSEADAFRLKKGDKARISTDVYPGTEYSGTVESIGSKSDEAHTFPAEITLSNSKEHPLRAGMFARVSLFGDSKRNVLAIPRTALVGSVKSAQVYTLDKGIARLHSVTVGDEFGTFLEVLEGLAAGETVVVSGQNNLRDGVEAVAVQ